MKQKLLFLLIVFGALTLNGQEINLKSAVTGTAGNGSEINSINISKWRIGEVHLVVLQQENLKNTNPPNWSIDTYPNPFTEKLNLQFRSDTPATYTITIHDLSGKKLLLNRKEKILANQLIRLDLAFLPAGTYLLTILPEDKNIQQVIRIQKL